MTPLEDIPQIPLARSVPVVAATFIAASDSDDTLVTVEPGTRGVVILTARDGMVFVSLDGCEEEIWVAADEFRVDLADPQGIAWAIRTAHESLDGRDITRILDEWCRAQGPLTDQSWNALTKAMEAHRA